MIIRKAELKDLQRIQVKRIGKEQVYKETIFLIGPVGVGKSLFSGELSKRNGLPVVATDMLRHCPKDLKVLEGRKKFVKSELKRCRKRVEKCEDIASLEMLERKVNSLHNDLATVERQIEMRKLLPNLPNYEEMGFNPKVSDFVRNNFGAEAWHFYQKQFENRLLQELTKQLDFACIVDMGGGMSISLDEDYARLAEDFRELDPNLFDKHFDLDQIGFDKIQSALEPFQNVVELQLPDDYKQTMHKASRDELNQKFIETKQNEKLAKQSVSVVNLFDEGKVNWEQVRKICSQIESQCGIRQEKEREL